MEPRAIAATKKGRGARSNASGRFEPTTRVVVDDGWERSDDDELPPLRTTVTVDSTRTIIARNDSPDIPFDRSINPYRGCEHGCIYCFARPSHAYLGLSPGLDFESRLFAKPDAARLLERELRAPSYRCEVMALGTNTDPYQPIERRLTVTRQILEVLSAFSHPVGIVTKSALVARDIDILAPMAKRKLARVFLSITTLDPVLARRMEPRAATPARRLETIKALADAGIPVGVMAAPMIPALNDRELESILEAAAGAGASAAGYILLRLPLEIKDLFAEWLEGHYPDRAKHVLNLVRGARGGALYDPKFGERMRGKGAYADLLANRFAVATKRLGLDRREDDALDTSQFKPPPMAGDQLSLL
ncbi:MAG: PA0069 family radical SAM protein [Alphaproteobacteria bacterium]